MANKVCSHCGTLCGPRNFFCPGCKQPFKKTLAKAKHSYIPINTGTVAHVAQQSRTITASPTPSTFTPNVFADKPGIFNLDPGHEFDDLLGKDDALAVAMSAMAVYNQTGGRNRYHILFIGSPSAGKSEIVTRIMNVVGRENVLEANAYSTSRAGMEETIIGYPTDLPNLLVYQEIDKTPNPDSLSWMLGALDTNQEVIRMNKTDGFQRRKVPFLCMATCNSLSKLEKMHGGAVASRFTHKLFIGDMTDDMRYEILSRKIKVLPNANDAWINPAIDYCRGIGDLSMRKIESVLMCGQDRLLTGEYQRSLGATQKL